jgi:monovalent cation:H+ antiporter-2, CPA2 family
VWEALVILLAFVGFAALFERLRLGTVVGFLLGGALIGPAGLGLVHDLAAVELLAELGVVFLLFNLGLELKLERLRLFGVRVYLLALTQLVVTAGVVAAAARAGGLGLEGALVIGGALALSSTAVVLQVLAGLGRTLTQLGRSAIAILLVQDIAVGPLLVLVKALGTAGGSLAYALALALGKAVLVVLVVVASARFLLRPLLGAIAALDVPEVFTAAALTIVIGASFATEHAGLSSALGAFVAGLMVADSEYRHQVAADIGAFRGLLLGIFFMAVGMSVDLAVALDHLGPILAITAGLIVIKALLLTGLAISFGFAPRVALQLGALLGQGSEFAFVLLGLAAGNGVLAHEVVQPLVVALALSMAITPLGAAFGRQLLDRLEGPASASLTELEAGTDRLRDHVVILGFGQVGMALARHLIGLGTRVLVLDYDPKRVRVSRAHGLPVYFGNAARADVLRAAHVGQARLVIVALPSAASAERVVTLLKSLYPKLRVLVRVPDEASVARLRAAGASAVVVDGLTTARDLAERAVLLYEPEAAAGEPSAGETVVEQAGV